VPYSREYNIFRQKVGKEAQGNTELQIEYEKILERVKQTRDSVIRMENRRFTAPVEEVGGRVESVSPAGITLKEFPGRRFQFSSVGMSAADMSARILGEQNNNPGLFVLPEAKTLARAREGHTAKKSAHLRNFSRAFLGVRSQTGTAPKKLLAHLGTGTDFVTSRGWGSCFPTPSLDTSLTKWPFLKPASPALV
jgi:hypothetical protein